MDRLLGAAVVRVEHQRLVGFSFDWWGWLIATLFFVVLALVLFGGAQEQRRSRLVRAAAVCVVFAVLMLTVGGLDLDWGEAGGW